MPSTTVLTVPRIHQFAVGEQVGSSDTLIGVFERLNAPLQDVIFGIAINEGPTNWTLSLTTGKAATGTLQVTAQPADGNTVVLNDGVNPAVTFEFDSNASVVQTNTLRQVIIGATMQQTVGALIAAIKSAPVLDISVLEPMTIYSSANVQFRLVNDRSGTAGNVAITETGTAVTVVAGMAGGTGAARNIRVNAASVASVVVRPQARVPFAIEIAAADVQDFLNFIATPTAGSAAHGLVTLAIWNGDFSHRNGYAYT